MDKPAPTNASGDDAPRGMRGLRLCTLFGIEIRLDASLLIIFSLIVFLLGSSVFPGWHPQWPAATTWLTAVAAGTLFFASLLAHELAHSLVSRRFGIEVRRITLFLFGGLAEIEEEPGEPRAEFLIAIAGPLTSLAIGLLCTTIGTQLAGEEVARRLVSEGQDALAALSPMASLLFWLGPVNIVLAVFNMVPGFPLDGGRVMRALIWWLSGDLRRATRIATESGRLFGWFLMALGSLQALSGGLVHGLWLVLIGWFLTNAAAASYRQVVVREVLNGITARDMMRSHFEVVPPRMRLSEFVDHHLLQSAQQLWPVVDEGQLVGLVTLGDVRAVDREDRAVATVGQVMTGARGARVIGADTSATRTMAALEAHQAPLAVVEEGRVIGLLSQADVAKWLFLR